MPDKESASTQDCLIVIHSCAQAIQDIAVVENACHTWRRSMPGIDAAKEFLMKKIENTIKVMLK